MDNPLEKADMIRILHAGLDGAYGPTLMQRGLATFWPEDAPPHMRLKNARAAAKNNGGRTIFLGCFRVVKRCCPTLLGCFRVVKRFCLLLFGSLYSRQAPTWPWAVESCVRDSAHFRCAYLYTIYQGACE